MPFRVTAKPTIDADLAGLIIAVSEAMVTSVTDEWRRWIGIATTIMGSATAVMVTLSETCGSGIMVPATMLVTTAIG